MYSIRNPDSASSREMPKVVWVRSLVPNEKKLCNLRDFICRQRRSRKFDHRLEFVFHFQILFLHHFKDHFLQGGLKNLQFIYMGGQRNHHLRLNIHPIFGTDAGDIEDGTNLHLGQFRNEDP